MAGPLAGIRIVDLTEEIAGPFATKQLADYGADVIKIERPAGDPARLLPPFPKDEPGINSSGLFAYLNTNKRSAIVDVDTPEGLATVERLAAGADAIVTSHPPGTPGYVPLDAARLLAANPKLVVAATTPYGSSGPLTTRKHTELTISARSSWLLTAGEPDREPLMYGGRQSEYLGGLHGAWGIIVALYHAARTGQGQVVDSSIYEATMMCFDQGIVGSSYINGHERGRTGRSQLRFPPVILPVADGYVSVLVTDLQWPRFCRMAEQSELAEDRQLRTQDGRIARFEELEVAFIPWFLTHTKAEVFEIAQQFGVPIAPFVNVSELLEDPQFKAKDFFRTVMHPVLGAVEMSGPPSRFDRTPWMIRRPAPLLGQHTAEVLAEVAA